MIDNFTKIGLTFPLKNKKVQTIANPFRNILNSSKRKPKTDRGREFLSKIFNNLSDNKMIEKYSRNTYLGAVCAEKYNRTFRDLLEEVAIGKGGGIWIDAMSTISKR